jgi:hypothetical protein
MKPKLNSLAVLALAIPLLFGGCQTTPQRKTFNTVWTLGSTVNESYKAYLDLVIAGQLPTNNVRRVSMAYNRFQDALSAATVLITANTNAPPPPRLLSLGNEFFSTVNAAKVK